MASLLTIGSGDGIFVIEAVLLSVLVAVLTWRRVGLAAGISATAIVALAMYAFNAMRPDASPGLNFRFVTLMFVFVPTGLLLAMSRQRWIARHAWVLVLVGPPLFLGCYIGICELCIKAGVI